MIQPLHANCCLLCTHHTKYYTQYGRSVHGLYDNIGKHIYLRLFISAMDFPTVYVYIRNTYLLPMNTFGST